MRTDQKSLKYLLEQREVTLDYQRWLTHILDYEFEIEYKMGSENKAADGLSRIVNHQSSSSTTLLLALTMPSTLQLHDLYHEIDTDIVIPKIVAQIVAGDSVKRGYSVVDGRLFYKHRLVVPYTSIYILLILQECHDGVFAGHSGVLKTLKRIQAVFYWKKMRTRV